MWPSPHVSFVAVYHIFPDGIKTWLGRDWRVGRLSHWSSLERAWQRARDESTHKKGTKENAVKCVLKAGDSIAMPPSFSS